MQFLLALLPLLGGFTEPLKQWFATKQKIAEKQVDYQLAVLTSETNKAVAEAESDTQQNRDRLGATSQGFKQSIYVWFALILTFSIVCPGYAKDMWANLELVPTWFQNLFVAMTLVTWGINPVKNGAQWLTNSVGDALSNRRDFKLEKAKIFNEKAYYDYLAKTIFTKGMTQQQFDDLRRAREKGEEG